MSTLHGDIHVVERVKCRRPCLRFASVKGLFCNLLPLYPRYLTERLQIFSQLGQLQRHRVDSLA